MQTVVPLLERYRTTLRKCSLAGVRSRARHSIQKNISIPPSVWTDIEEAMKLDGITSFSQFALAAVMQRTMRIKRQHTLLDTQQVADLAPKIRSLLTELEQLPHPANH